MWRYEKWEDAEIEWEYKPINNSTGTEKPLYWANYQSMQIDSNDPWGFG